MIKQLIVEFPEFPLILRAFRGLCADLCARVDTHQRKMLIDEGYFVSIITQHFLHRRIHPTTKWTLEVRKFYNGDRRAGFPPDTRCPH